LRFILRDEPESVFTAATYDDRNSSLETSASMHLKFHNGALGNINVSILSPYRTPFEVVGVHGSIRAQDFFSVEKPVELVIEAAGGVRRETHSNHDAYVRQFDAFALSVKKGVPFAALGEEGLTNQRVLDAAFRSTKSGRAETF
jgi:predicted dehydrogenase